MMAPAATTGFTGTVSAPPSTLEGEEVGSMGGLVGSFGGPFVGVGKLVMLVGMGVLPEVEIATAMPPRGRSEPSVKKNSVVVPVEGL
jgi:hypothetical protein